MLRRPAALLAGVVLALSAACSKKRGDPPPPPAPAQPSVSAHVATTANEPAPSVSASAAPAEPAAIDAELMLPHELALAEGKVLPAPKFVPATAAARKEHAAALQTVFEEQVKGGCDEVSRFNASHIPATYVVCALPAREATAKLDARANITRMITVEGTSVSVEDLASRGEAAPEHGDPTAFELWSTPRGFYIDLTGSGKPVYFLRRDRMVHSAEGPSERRVECRGKAWDPEDGSVQPISVPHFPTRGRDVDGDGAPEFPDAIFRYSLEGYALDPAPAVDGCDVENDGRLSLDVVGIESNGAFRSFYEHRLAVARARANRARTWAGLAKLSFLPADAGPAAVIEAGTDAPKATPRKKGELRLSNDCALDVAQAAAELYVYARVLGTAADEAMTDADALMKGFAVKLGECRGGLRSGDKSDGGIDHWPAIRTALLAWAPARVYAAGAP